MRTPLVAVAIASAVVLGSAPSGNGTAALAAEPGSLRAIIIELAVPGQPLTLAGRDAARQLIVTGTDTLGKFRDLSSRATYRAQPAGIVAIDPTGHVTPLAEGNATIDATFGGKTSAPVEIVVSHLATDLPVSFPNQVVPVFTKFGCNAGGCHGKAEGQNGFRLSLLGFEPADDYQYLVQEGRGRRIFPSAPEHSLLLRKAAGLTPHGGGERFAADSPYYRVIRRWIEQGAPYGPADAPVVARIEVFPAARLLPRDSSQQLAVIAHFSDGTAADVTRMTQFDPVQPEMSAVSATGLVTTKNLVGGAAVMARFQSQVAVFQATIPRGEPVEQLPPAANFIDELVFERLRDLGLPPSPVGDDLTFLRRATIDIAGRLPTRDEVEAFAADADANKRSALIDRLLGSDDYATYFANKWSAILRNRRRSASDKPEPTFAFHEWIVESLATNKPYDQFVREVLTAQGEEVKSPPVIWYREVKDQTAQLEDAAQLFLGQRIGCARCHHHPFEKWSQQDYYGFAAFFSQLDIREAKAGKKGNAKKNEPDTPGEPFRVLLKANTPTAVHPRTGLAVPPAGLGSPPLAIDKNDDAREKLADWMADPANPFFARALVNRYWKHFFGRGLVDPEDDLRMTNPPSNPELLGALARHFVEHRFDLKDLVRTICHSRAYQLSSTPNAYNADDRQNFSRFVPRRLHAEVLLDAIDAVTLAKTSFKGVSPETRAVELPDNLFDNYFLSVFGRPDAASACECERSGDATLAQCLHLFNSTDMLGKLAGKRSQTLGNDKRPHAERIRDLYLVALAREPRPAELAAFVAYVENKPKNGQEAYEDVIWTLVNTKEFLFNH
ncbi:MAG: DUF1549 and DUF1553 domain-containing protein [Pirellulaceae bacterium]|nr:DUF1549 and DUF1553 domain-containing protein [Pirellulaceae bacterium]